MKRSELNRILRDAVEFIERQNYHLPPFAFWGPEEWETKGHEYDEIRDNRLGWDITDFGVGDFENLGLLLFTVRNGNAHMDQYIKPYAEKLMITRENQVTPFHFHWNKMEDIIVRGGGNLIVEVCNSTEEGELADTEVEVSIDGRRRTLDPGSKIRLEPGESITVPTGLYHRFWAEGGTGKSLVGEVSMVNDDDEDNRFLREDIGRWPGVEEDEPPLYYLCTEYPPAG